MPSLLLVVFILQVAIYLVNTIGAQTINELAWVLYNKLPTPTSAAASKSQIQRRNLIRMKQEMAGVSAQDEFARWAKMRRQYDKAEAEYQRHAQTLASSRATFDKTAGTARWVLTSGLRLVLQFWYNRTPLFWLPKGLVPSYVEWALAFPRAPRGSVSMQVWTMACASVVAMVGEAVLAGLVLARGSGKASKAKQESQPVQAEGPSGGNIKKEL